MTLGEYIRRFREARGWTLEKLSELSGVDIGTISALEMRKSRRSQFAPQIAAAFGVSTDDLLTGQDRTPSNVFPLMGVDPDGGNREIQNSRIVTPKRMTWGEAVSGRDFAELFILSIPDDANGPQYPRGLDVIWSTTKPAQIGSLVLVRDASGGLHAREMRQGRNADHWIAAPENRAYASFDSVLDGLQVVAVAAYKALP